jgi:hypothetical protein
VQAGLRRGPDASRHARLDPSASGLTFLRRPSTARLIASPGPAASALPAHNAGGHPRGRRSRHGPNHGPEAGLAALAVPKNGGHPALLAPTGRTQRGRARRWVPPALRPSPPSARRSARCARPASRPACGGWGCPPPRPRHPPLPVGVPARHRTRPRPDPLPATPGGVPATPGGLGPLPDPTPNPSASRPAATHRRGARSARSPSPEPLAAPGAAAGGSGGAELVHAWFARSLWSPVGVPAALRLPSLVSPRRSVAAFAVGVPPPSRSGPLRSLGSPARRPACSVAAGRSGRAAPLRPLRSLRSPDVAGCGSRLRGGWSRTARLALGLAAVLAVSLGELPNAYLLRSSRRPRLVSRGSAAFRFVAPSAGASAVGQVLSGGAGGAWPSALRWALGGVRWLVACLRGRFRCVRAGAWLGRLRCARAAVRAGLWRRVCRLGRGAAARARARCGPGWPGGWCGCGFGAPAPAQPAGWCRCAGAGWSPAFPGPGPGSSGAGRSPGSRCGPGGCACSGRSARPPPGGFPDPNP